MKLNKLKIACALALTGVSGQALALTPYEAQAIDLVNGKDYVYLSGSSAQNFLGTLVTQIFEPGYITYYDNNGTTSSLTDDGKLYRAYFGRVKNDSSIPAAFAALKGKTLRLLHRVEGGSESGMSSVARATAVATLKMDAANCVLNAGIYRCAEAGMDPGAAADPTNPLSNASYNKVPDAGVSDVAPNMFKGPFNVEFGSAELSSGEAAKLTSFPVNTLMMGLAVANTVPATGPNATYLSRADYGAMLSGAVQDWTQVKSSLALAPGPQVVVCRQTPGSGTQASYNWFFNNFPCTTQSIVGSGDTPPARMSDSASGVVSGSGTAADPFVIDPTAGYTVLENSTSGNVRDCLQKASTGGVHTFKDEEGKFYRVNFGTGGYGAVGVLSLDSLGKESGWSFRNMDGAGDYKLVSGSPVVTGTGVAPSKANLVEGRYDFAAELAMQYRNATVNGVPALSGNAKLFMDLFIQRGGHPDFNTSHWTAALPVRYDPATSPNVSKATRGGNGNMCKPLQRYY